MGYENSANSIEMPATTRKSPRGKIQFESPHYRVYKNQPHLLYIKDGTPVPPILIPYYSFSKKYSPPPQYSTRKFSPSNPSKRSSPNKYSPYKYRYDFSSEDNDCLQFAEGLAKGVVSYTGTQCVFSVKGSGRKFGVTDKKNIELALKNRKDEKAKPFKGQAYAIVRTDLLKLINENPDEEFHPYHIAFVILEDGDWRITLEANAADTDLSTPEFGIYSVENPDKSFHSEYKGFFGDENAATIVLEKNDA